MNKIINKILFYTKFIFLLIAFTVTLYILLIRMDSFELSAFSIFPLFIPLLLVLISFVFSSFLNIGKDNLFFNVTCLLVTLAIIVIDYRTIFDSNIISDINININYFNLFVGKIKIMLYLLLITNILILINEKNNKIHS